MNIAVFGTREICGCYGSGNLPTCKPDSVEMVTILVAHGSAGMVDET